MNENTERDIATDAEASKEASEETQIMGISNVSCAVPFLDSLCCARKPMSVRSLCVSAILGIAFWCCALTSASAYTIVTSTAPGVETQFLANTQNEWASSLFVNPLVANTFQLKLFGPNPNYNPPPSIQQIFNAGVLMSTQTYLYGWRDGMAYQQNAQIGQDATQENLCDSATSFMLIYTTTSTWNPATCRDVIGQIINDLYLLSLSTPTPIPGMP